ncbi:MAG: nickel pincer cofactor biosynthesis protein LarB [Planctomycetaceae bacterium]|nr:nickel pincer cofactor biosynthesis protein LarB [Planctomycetaceae bacterium]
MRQLQQGFATDGDSVTASIDGVQVDLDRQRRCGFPEVIYAEGKSAQTVVDVFARLVEAKQDCLATRVSPEQAHWLLENFPEATYHPEARTVRLSQEKQPQGRVLVVTAGTSDRPVAEEAIETLRWMHCGCELIVDVGVAGPRRLLAQLSQFEGADAVIVVAGMEGALPSVVGGWVNCPVIAVPTSVGYGASLGGLTALLGMLNSCAANVTVVNIDAGFKAGYIAGLIAHGKHARAE